MELTSIGYFCKTHGIKGHLVLKDEASFITEGLAALFIEGATGKAPYFITELRETNNGLLFKLEEVDAVEKAKLLIGKPVYVDSKFIEEEEVVSDWIGFELIDTVHGSLGLVTGSSDNGSQDLLSLVYKDREIILPFIEEFIEKIDETGRKIWYNAPEGLIDLYLNDQSEEEG